MTSEGKGEMFEGDSADMCTVKFQLISIGRGQVEGLPRADTGDRTPTGVSGNSECFAVWTIIETKGGHAEP
jgi:hypothetical protein